MNLAKRTHDAIFRALADGTRRQVIESLSSGPKSISTLAEPFEMALPSFMQHIRILERAGLIRSAKNGRVRNCHLALESLDQAERWIKTQLRSWEMRLDQLEAAALEELRSSELSPTKVEKNP
jgi:DNA-binding transcriptional ArsR family regulator